MFSQLIKKDDDGYSFTSRKKTTTQSSQGKVTVASAAGGSTILAANANRVLARITNISNRDIWLSFDGNTPIEEEGLLLGSNGESFNITASISVGEIKGIAKSGNKDVSFIEFED